VRIAICIYDDLSDSDDAPMSLPNMRNIQMTEVAYLIILVLEEDLEEFEQQLTPVTSSTPKSRPERQKNLAVVDKDGYPSPLSALPWHSVAALSDAPHRSTWLKHPPILPESRVSRLGELPG